MAYLGRSLSKDTMWRRKASDTFPRLKSDLSGDVPFVRECHKALRNLPGSSDLSRPRKELYRNLVVDSASDTLVDRLVDGGGGFTRIKIGRQVRVPWTTLSSRSPDGLHETRCPFSAWITKRVKQACPIIHAAAVAKKKRLTTPSTTVSEFVRFVGEWTARIEPKQLVLFDVGYVVDNVLPSFQGKKRVVFLTILVVALMVIWTTQKKGLYDDTNFSHRDMILFFRHQLRVKIRCNRKRLDRITFDRRWVHTASLVVRKGATLEYPSLLFLRMATTDRVIRDHTPGM